MRCTGGWRASQGLQGQGRLPSDTLPAEKVREGREDTAVRERNWCFLGPQCDLLQLREVPGLRNSWGRLTQGWGAQGRLATFPGK